jgi:hypothetical protein
MCVRVCEKQKGKAIRERGGEKKFRDSIAYICQNKTRKRMTVYKVD